MARRWARRALGLACGAVCVALIVSTELEDVDVECGVAPVAAFTHDAAPCRDAGRGQTNGAVGAGAAAMGLLAGPLVARRLWSRGFVDPPPAHEHVLTALDGRAENELRRIRRRARGMVVAGVALLVLFTTVGTVVAPRAEDLERSGIRKGGVVVEIDHGRHGDSLVVEFHWRTERRERIHLDGSSPDYELGQQVVVLIDQSDLDRVSLRGEDNQEPGWVLLLVVLVVAALGALVVGVAMLGRNSRQRLVLQRHEWRRFDATLIEGPGGRARRLALLTDGAHPEGMVLTLAPTSSWLASIGLGDAGSVDAAGRVPGYVVLRTPLNDALTSARSPRLSSTERRWRRRLVGGGSAPPAPPRPPRVDAV